jgi:hypothetical protein
MFDGYYNYKFITKLNPLHGNFYISKSIFSFEAETYRYIQLFQSLELWKS